MGVIGKTLRFTLGLTLGVVLGAVATLLLAPQSGKVTKEQLQQRIDEIMQAGQSAQREREKELQTYWEQQIKTKA
ncbi:MAG: YtxH domain-containing protein [Chloroflexia bacterium]